jgi:triacylglycerol lipase
MSRQFQKLDDRDKSAFFARLSMLAYEEPKVMKRTARTYGFEARLIENGNAEAYLLESESVVIVACRGTQPTQIKDIKTDLEAWPKRSQHAPMGLVHFGFQKYVNKIWQEVSRVVMNSVEKDLYFTGHSLGGAMASIMAIYCQANPILMDPVALYTYGSPRVGTGKFVKQGRPIYHERWVNNVDIVTSVPMALLGYRHFGQQMYINHYGNVRPVTAVQQLKDRWRGLVKGLKAKKINYIINHDINRYVTNIERWRDDIENPQE